LNLNLIKLTDCQFIGIEKHLKMTHIISKIQAVGSPTGQMPGFFKKTSKRKRKRRR
jgi:hypothetical protein